MISYSMFYKRLGIRRVDQLSSPVLSPTGEMSLPLGSHFHFIGNEFEVGPSKDYFLLQGSNRLSWLEHIAKLGSLEGKPRPHLINYTGEINNYHRINPRVKRLLKDPSTVLDQKLVVGTAYSGLSKLYIYANNVYRDYYKWYNTWFTVWSHVEKIGKSSNREQFIVLSIPEYVPTIGQLTYAESKIDQTSLHHFHDDDGFNVLDIWKWLGENRKDSLLGKLSLKSLQHVNLVFLHKGQFAILNLGLLNSWRNSTAAEKLEDADSALRGLDPIMLQKRFLHFVLTLKGINLEESVQEEVELDAAAEVQDKILVTPKDLTEQNTMAQAFKLDDDDEDVSIDEEPEEAAIELSDQDIDADLAVHEEIVGATSKGKPAVIEESDEIDPTIDLLKPAKPYVRPNPALESGVTEIAMSMVEMGNISLADYRRLEGLATSYKSIQVPDLINSSKGPLTIEQAININSSELALTPATFPDSNTTLDKSMLQSTLVDFTSRYVRHFIHRDILGSVMAIQRNGIAVTDIDVVEKADALNHYYQYSVKLVPPGGKPTTVSFKIPVVTDEGTIQSGGVNYYLKTQRSDIPIRKIGPARVALTSYYGKLFIDRSENATVNYGKWLTNQVTAIGLDQEDVRITQMKMSANFDKTLDTPRAYSSLASKFRSFTVRSSGTNKFDFDFNLPKLRESLPPAAVTRVENINELLVGKDQTGAPIGMDGSGKMTIYRAGASTPLGTFEELLQLDRSKAPTEIAVVNIFGKSVPLAIVLGYHMGISALLDLLGVKPRLIPRGKIVKRLDTEYVIQFKDYTMVLDKVDKRATLIIAGFKAYHRHISGYNVKDFDNKDIYINVLEMANLSVRWVREIDLIYKMYIDDITRGLLEDMNEPTNMVDLFLRSAELLTNDKHPDEIDGGLTRYKGYERFAGTVYQELIKASRMKAARPMSMRVGLEVNPEAVWQQILQDSAMEVTNDINPIQNLKQKEVVTFGGTGGRTADTMVKRTRVYHEKDLGIISEAGVDSGAVGVITYFSPNPGLVDLRGRVKTLDGEPDGLGSIFSTSALLAPSSDRDDMKRVGFISIQQSHGISSKGNRASPLRTGYGAIMAQRTDDLFACAAKGNGKVIAKDAKSLTIEYENGDLKYIELGRRFGKSAGSVMPHFIVTNKEVGDSFVIGDILTYNTEYFEPDWMNPGKVEWRGGTLAKTLLMDTVDTFEDSSVISSRLAVEMSTATTHIRNIVLDFDQAPHQLVTSGSKVDFESILCTIEDPVTAGANLFDENTIETLKLLSNAAPKAKYTGVVEHIEVFYNGDVEDMSEQLQALVMATDRSMSKLYRSLGKPKITGKVDGTYRIDGNPLLKNQAVINVYITSDVQASVGDKFVFANQMKTTCGRVMTGINRCKDGTDIDAIFAYESMSNRIVESPEVIGTTNTLLRVIGNRFAEIYKKG